MMDTLIETLSGYGWWIAGLILLVLEVLLPGVYLIFFGIAAFIVGMNTLVPGAGAWFGWEQQVIAFIVLSAVCLFVGRSWYGSMSVTKRTTPLNHGARRLVGREVQLFEPIVNGRGRVAIEDGWWMVQGPDLPASSQVRIVDTDGALLIVEPADGSEVAPSN